MGRRASGISSGTGHAAQFQAEMRGRKSLQTGSLCSIYVNIRFRRRRSVALLFDTLKVEKTVNISMVFAVDPEVNEGQFAARISFGGKDRGKGGRQVSPGKLAVCADGSGAGGRDDQL